MALRPNRDTAKMLVADRVRSLVELDTSFSPPVALTDRIYALLKRRIVTCALVPSQRLVEKDLCAEFGVSRTPFREACNRLALEGLIVMIPYRGYAVAPLTVDSYRELCEVRRIVEGEAAGLAAQRATEQDIEQLAAAAPLEYTPGDHNSYDCYLRGNYAFHQALVRCTGNRQLEAIVMSGLDRHARQGYLGLDTGINAREATAEHLMIVHAVRSHSPDLARASMITHISRAELRITGALREAGY
jgi:DNA-binding GntR family transcriptional regulator